MRRRPRGGFVLVVDGETGWQPSDITVEGAARVDGVVVAAADAGEIQYLWVEGSVLNFADD